MNKHFLTLAVLLLSLNAQAELRSATHYGFSADSGYLTAVTPPDKCQSADQLLVTDNDSGDATITKCDSSIIGWVETTLNGAYLEEGSNGEFDAFVGEAENGAPEYLDFYTCDFTRASDVARDPSVKMSTDTEGNTLKLRDLLKRKAMFKAQLFFNESLLSGKCLGQITEVIGK